MKMIIWLNLTLILSLEKTIVTWLVIIHLVKNQFTNIYQNGMNLTYEESKQKTFRLLYGGIDKQTREKVPFFDLTHNYINKKWNEINTHNLVSTDIYRRKLLFKNYEDLNRNKFLII